MSSKYKSQQPGWKASQAKRLAAYHASRNASKPAYTPAQRKTIITGISRGPEQNMEVGNHTGLQFGSDLNKALQTSVFAPYLPGGSRSSLAGTSSVLTPSLPTTQVSGYTPAYQFGSGVSSKIKGTSFSFPNKKEPDTKKYIKKTKDVKTLESPKAREGYEFIGYDDKGRPKYRDIDAYFKETHPWLTDSGDYKKSYKFKTEEDVMANVDDPVAQQYYIGKLQGFDVSDWASSEDEELNLFQKEQDKDKSELERQLNYAKGESARTRRESEAALIAQLQPGREGVVSESNIATLAAEKGVLGQAAQQYVQQANLQMQELDKLQSQQLKDYSSSRADRIMTLQAQIQKAQNAATEAANTQREQTMEYLNMMQDSGALAYADPETLNYLSQGLPGAPQGFVEMISKAATRDALNEDQQRRFDNQQTAVSTLKSMADAGMSLTPELMMQYSKQTGIPFESIYAFNEQADMIRQDKQMDTATKALNLQKLGYELDRESRGILTSQLQNIDYLTSLYQQGASSEQIAFVKNALGIKDMDDPKYRLEIESAILKNDAQRITNAYLPSEKQIGLENLSLDGAIKKLDEYMKSVDAKYLPEEKRVALEETVLNMKKANEEIKKTFGTPVFINQDGKYQINQTPDGIKVAASSGEAGGQCGRFVNNYLGESVMGDSYEQKMSQMDPNITEGSPGMVFVMPYKDTGHTGVIERVYYDAQGRKMYDVVDSNWRLDEKVRRHTIAADKITGYMIPDNAVSGTVKAPSTPAEKLAAMENKMPDAYKWLGTSMNIAYGEDKAPDKLQRVQDLIEQGRGEEASDEVYAAIMSKAPQDKLVDLKNTIYSFQELNQSFKEFEAWAKKTGFKPGKISELENDANVYFKNDIPKDYYVYYRKVNESFAAYLKSLSGVAVSEQEANRVRKLFGSPNMPITQNKVTMEQLAESANRELNTFVDTYSDGQVKTWADLDKKLSSIRDLTGTDLKVSDYSTYEPGNLSSLFKNVKGTATYWLNNAPDTIDPNLFNRY